MATSFFNNNCEDEVEELESAKQYADLARDWAIKMDGLVDGIDFSSKFWANQAAIGAGARITIKEDGTPLGDQFTTLNFGAGVTATQTTTNEVLIQSTGQILVETFDDGVGFIAGTSDEITLATEVVSKNNIDIYFDGMYQNKETYDVSGVLVTFDSVIPVGVGEIEVVYPRLMDVGIAAAENVTFGSTNVDDELVSLDARLTVTESDITSLDGRLTIVERSALVNRPFPNVAAVDTATFLQTGDFVEWLGYTTPGDGGGNKGEIGTGFGTADNGSVFDLSGSGLQARGLFPLGFTSPKQWGAVGDGVADDTVPVSNWQAFTGIQLSPSGDYNTPGSVGASGSTRVLIADNTSESGSDIPYLTIADEPFKTLPKNHVFVQQDTANRSDAVCVQIQRIVSTDDGNTNPKALRAITVVNDGTGGNQVEYAISGEVENSDNSGTAVEGGTSISGVSLKKAAGTGVMFGGHFQVKDETDAATVGGIVGVECNIQANGPDTNSNRIGFDLIARTYEPGTLAGEFSAGLRIRNSSTIDGGKWTNAILIQDGVQTTPQAITIENSPGTIVGYGIEDSGQKARGIDLQGQYGIAAIDAKNSNLTTSDVVIRLKDKGKIQFDDASNSFIKWDSAVNSGGGSLVLGGQSTQTTVGAAGAASALPANPTGYLNLNINGADFVLPFYNQA